MQADSSMDSSTSIDGEDNAFIFKALDTLPGKDILFELLIRT